MAKDIAFQARLGGANHTPNVEMIELAMNVYLSRREQNMDVSDLFLQLSKLWTAIGRGDCHEKWVNKFLDANYAAGKKYTGEIKDELLMVGLQMVRVDRTDSTRQSCVHAVTHGVCPP